MASNIVAGYPKPSGGKWESVFTHKGPTSYTQVTPGSPATGGDTLQASEGGLKFFDIVHAGVSDDGQYEVFGIPGSGVGEPASVTLMWKVAATGAEVAGAVNLSARTVRLRVMGG